MLGIASGLEIGVVGSVAGAQTALLPLTVLILRFLSFLLLSGAFLLFGFLFLGSLVFCVAGSFVILGIALLRRAGCIFRRLLPLVGSVLAALLLFVETRDILSQNVVVLFLVGLFYLLFTFEVQGFSPFLLSCMTSNARLASIVTRLAAIFLSVEYVISRLKHVVLEVVIGGVGRSQGVSLSKAFSLCAPRSCRLRN